MSKLYRVWTCDAEKLCEGVFLDLAGDCLDEEEAFDRASREMRAGNVVQIEPLANPILTTPSARDPAGEGPS